jgi:hypothetical protein
MDDFLIDVAIILDVSQTELENGYYMADLPALLSAKRKHDAANRLGDIFMLIATNSRSVEEADYKTYIRGLNKEVGVKEEQGFNRDKFEELRMFAK